jgi:hypothetical protein
MTVSIDQSSVKTFIMPDRIAPDVRIRRFGFMPDNKFVIDGVALFVMSNSDPSLKSGIQFGGHAEFSLGPGDSLSGWKVGFMQIIYQSVSITRYSGRTPTEGSIICDDRPAISSGPLLDCLNKNTIPWVNTDRTGLFTGGTSSGKAAAINTQDHPSTGAPLAMKNRATSVYNFLYDFRQEQEFWTILTAMDPAGARQYLGYCHWRVVHKVDFIWPNAAPQSTNWGAFTRLDQDKGQFVPGAPTEADLQPILANPVGPIANDVLRKSHAAAVDPTEPGGNFWSHTESDKGLSPIRPDFWSGSLPPYVG